MNNIVNKTNRGSLTDLKLDSIARDKLQLLEFKIALK